LAAFVAAPFVGVWIKKPVVYDAQRHFLFLLPPLAALCGIGLSACAGELEAPRMLRFAGCALWCGLAAFVLFDMTKLHPYEYVYFNRSYGGLPKAEGRFEIDYWGASFREGFDWVVKNVEPNSRSSLRVATCSNGPGRWQLEYMRERWKLEDKYVVVDDTRQAGAHIYLEYTRYNCHKRRGRVLHVVERQGVPLLYVLQR
jgi:hypothetical protein